MKPISILELLEREYLGKEVELYVIKKKVNDKLNHNTFYFYEPYHLEGYYETTITVDKIFADEKYDYELFRNCYTYTFMFEYEGLIYMKEFLK